MGYVYHQEKPHSTPISRSIAGNTSCLAQKPFLDNTHEILSEVAMDDLSLTPGEEDVHEKHLALTESAVVDVAQTVSECVTDTFECLFQREQTSPRCRLDYVDHQEKPHIRRDLMNWIVEKHRMLGLRLETLFLAITITDNYLARTGCRKMN